MQAGNLGVDGCDDLSLSLGNLGADQTDFVGLSLDCLKQRHNLVELWINVLNDFLAFLLDLSDNFKLSLLNSGLDGGSFATTLLVIVAAAVVRIAVMAARLWWASFSERGKVSNSWISNHDSLVHLREESVAVQVGSIGGAHEESGNSDLVVNSHCFFFISWELSCFKL